MLPVVASLAWHEVGQWCCKQFLQVAVGGGGPPRQRSTVSSSSSSHPRQHASFLPPPHSCSGCRTSSLLHRACASAGGRKRQRSDGTGGGSPARGTVSRQSAVGLLAGQVCRRPRQRRAKGNQRFLRQVSASPQLQKHRAQFLPRGFLYFFQFIVLKTLHNLTK